MAKWQVALLKKLFPWGSAYIKRSNYQYGYLQTERELVSKYLKPVSDILVLGSGNGREARPICRDRHNIICMDKALAYLESGNRLFMEEGIANVRFVVADICNGLPFKRHSFDFVFFSFYSSLGSLRFNVIQDVYRIIKPNGLLLLTCSTPLYLVLHRKSHLKDWVFIGSTEELGQEVSECGFEFIESRVDTVRQEYRFSMLKKL